ncbi:hypothetical protein K488DRAFT_89017 [Vararia minispora EC-137]|uniref:Uncharacterized protein n=1 Tax=Vararia minispora EC-137 TaxID=1314806 RepID=A0ACB8QBU3_9AGAM|nr:hypothetical protein K488DRAFT_89017 [Vararia minispora EC-137]
MAAPAEISILNLTGRWIMNKTLSDSSDEILALQGVPWLKRKLIGAATVTLHIKHYKDDAGVEHIDIRQTLTGGIEGNDENRTLDWTMRDQINSLFGPVKGRSRRVNPEELEVPWLKDHFLPEISEHGTVHAFAESDTEKSGTTWTSNQTWGFEDVNGERRYTRRIDFYGPEGEHLEKRLVYDYAGSLQ